MEPDAYFQNLVIKCRDDLDCEFVNLYVLDERTQGLTLIASVGYAKELIGAERYQVGTGLTGWITPAGELLITDPSQQTELPHNEKDKSVHSLIGVPLKGKEGKVIGVLHAGNKKAPERYFSQDDVKKLEWFAASAAIAILLQQEDRPSRKHVYVFVLMPFDTSFDDIYEYGIKQPVERLGMTCERVDEIQYNGGVMDKFYECVDKARFIIADMTGRNPNVFYEVGYCHAMKKDIILCTQKEEEIPFDLRGLNHIVYAGKITDLEKALRKRILSMLKNEEE